jgi:hypothetical protein
MRLKLNLATQPYEDARQFAIAWGSVVGVLLLLVIVLSVGVVNRWHRYRQMSSDLNRERQILQDLDAKQREGLAILNRPENLDVREKSAFINDLITRKQVSWTTIFTDLEQLMPPRLHVLGVEPISKDGKVQVQMLLAGESRDRVAELAGRMEKSNAFRDVLIDTEAAGELQPGRQRTPNDDQYRFRITAEFMPGVQLAKPETPKSGEGGGQ